MSRKAFNKIAAGLKEAIAVARGEAEPTRLYIPPEIDVSRIRKHVKLSQSGFAETFGFTITQVKDWEQKRSRPIGGVRAYLMLIARNPEKVRTLLGELQR